jgi:phosphoribosylformylglycinamidine synthase
MVLAVPPVHLERFEQLCKNEDVELAVIGKFVPTGTLRLMYEETEVGSLSMEFLHSGRPPVIRQAVYEPKSQMPCELGPMDRTASESLLEKILSHPTVASKHWIIRQYDHEVQGGSVVKPLVGPSCMGPSDASVVRPKLESRRAVVLACGMNPRFGDLDPYHMATSAIDEAVRNAICVGAKPDRLAILDNFCWGNTDRPETLGSLVRAAIACYDLAIEWKTPFISGKDSLNNEFTWFDAQGKKESIAIPCSLLISAIGQIDDASQAVTMDLKQAGNALYLIGVTRNELGGSHAAMLLGKEGGAVPTVDAALAMRCYQRVHQAILKRHIVSCHDLSEGGLAVALSEMAFAGELGVQVDLTSYRASNFVDASVALFSESNSRLLVEVPAGQAQAFESLMSELPVQRIGMVNPGPMVCIESDGQTLIDVPWTRLRELWRSPLDFA